MNNPGALADCSGPIMHIHIITLFPEFFAGPLDCGLMRRAREAGVIRFSLHNPRDLATDKHRSVDDRPYGGGPGMVMLAQPVCALLRELGYEPRGGVAPGRLLLLNPSGRVFTQKMAEELASVTLSADCGPATREDDEVVAGLEMPATGESSFRERIDSSGKTVLTLICGRYEGLDARVEELYPVESVSVGDFVLNGGEAGALCLIEAVARLLPGYMGHEDSGEDESFSKGLLEYPHFTRPDVFEGLRVPEALQSGDHGRVFRWRRQASLARTLAFRPDLLDEASLDNADRQYLKSIRVARPGRNLFCALVHHPVLDKMQNSVAVSLTNLDIHDIARSSCAYGLGGYYVLTPIADQRDLLDKILAHWTDGPGKRSNPDRDAALRLVRGLSSVREAAADIAQRTGQTPLVIATTARENAHGLPGLPFSGIADMLEERPVLLLLGTGHGLAPEVLEICDACAPPVRWHGGYNHLSVRSALAVMLDRILGDWR